MQGVLKQSFENIYNQTYKGCLSYVISKCANFCDVEDILQEIYAELFSVMKKKGLDYVTNYQAFVMNIAKFKIFSFYKNRKIEVPLTRLNDDGDEYSNYDIDDINIEERYENVETMTEINKFLAQKSTDIQKIFKLYYFVGNTIREIADLLQLTESKVKHKLYDTLKQLRKLYS